MAPATPQRKKRAAQNNYVTNIGEQGRKTGLTLPEQPRDEYGMEPADSLFTSPMKSARTATQSRRKSSRTNTSSEAMDVEESSAPELTDVLSIRASQKRTSIPPPTRSPLRKTNIGGTPRRHPSLGAQSSPERDAQTPEPRSTPNRPVPRLLNFSVEDSVSSTNRTKRRRSTPHTNGIANGNDASAHSTRHSPVPQASSGEDDGEDYATQAGGDDDDDVSDVGGTGFEVNDDDDGYTNGDVELDAHANNSAGEGPSSTAKRRRSSRRGRGSLVDPTLLDEDAANGENAQEEEQEEAEEEQEAEAGQEQNPQDASQDIAAPAKKRGRGRPKKSEAKEKTAALAPKDRNAPVKGDVKGKGKGKSKSKAPAPAPAREARAGSVTSLQRQREFTPNEDDGATFTRSGRLSYRPLSYWKGEEAKYESDGRHGMQTIHSVVRKEDVTPIKRLRPVQKKRKHSVFGDKNGNKEEQAISDEPWELGEGLVAGLVRIWDPDTGGSMGEREQEIAIAGQAIDPAEVQGADFRYAKTLTLGYFGTGIVELPPHGFKRMKNSRKMTMVFFVHYGKVAVDVAGTRFTISKGGVWQVPRGNLYSITNETEYEAKIFFAQGCQEVAQRVPVEELEQE